LQGAAQQNVYTSSQSSFDSNTGSNVLNGFLLAQAPPAEGAKTQAANSDLSQQVYTGQGSYYNLKGPRSDQKPFDPNAFAGAMYQKKFDLGSRVLVTNLDVTASTGTHPQVVIDINDHGPFKVHQVYNARKHKYQWVAVHPFEPFPGRPLDLTRAAYDGLQGPIENGVRGIIQHVRIQLAPPGAKLGIVKGGG